MSVVGSIVVESVEALIDCRPAIAPSRCSRAASPRSRCSLCTSYCPSHSVSVGAKGPSVHATCLGCDVCVAVCPAGAFYRSERSDEALLTGLLGLRRDDALEVGCTASRGKLAPLRCVGRLNALLLLHLAAAGVSELTLDMGCCPTCATARGLGHLADDVEAGKRLAQAIGVDLRVKNVCTAGSRVDEPPRTSRRGLFGFLRPESPPPRPAGPKPMMHMELRPSALAVLATRLAVNVEPTSRSWPFWRVSVDNLKCTGCKACSSVCATSALTRKESARGARLTCDPGACTGCGACVAGCRLGALSLEPARLDSVVRGAATVVVATGHYCRLCGQLVPGEQDGPCALCSRRR